jgi:ABC-type phosphate transport system ATPase subunit
MSQTNGNEGTDMSTAEFEEIAMIEEANVSAPAVPVDQTIEMDARDISIWFGQRKVLEGVNIAFPKNTVTALIGPSGCGKSTFLRTLNRLHELIPGAKLSGEIHFEGSDIYAPEVDPVHIRLKVGMVFQKPNPFPSMTIRGNVLSGLKLSGLKRDNSPVCKRSAQVQTLFHAKLFTVATAIAQAKAKDKRTSGSLMTHGKAISCITYSTAMLTTVPDAPTVANRT